MWRKLAHYVQVTLYVAVAANNIKTISTFKQLHGDTAPRGAGVPPFLPFSYFVQLLPHLFFNDVFLFL